MFFHNTCAGGGGADDSGFVVAEYFEGAGFAEVDWLFNITHASLLRLARVLG